jgi:NADH-quinone oxidoreductase subunit L
MTIATAAWVCLLAPLAGALLITLAGNRLSRRAAGYLATLSTSVSFGAALVGFSALLGEDSEERSHVTTAWTWLRAGDFEAGLSLLVDPLSMMMMLIVSGVGSLIVAYSIGYMDGDDEERRFFAYMAFFVFSMLLLVEGANLVLLLAGWGLVGLASYLLIGFHHDRPSAIAAAKKAFVMNAVGDATMALAIFLLFWQTGVVDFAGVFERVDGLSTTVVTLAALGLLGGAVAKSAQIPLQTWLPDAMEGPTPVSALIHAATMVTAGVYLLVRLNPVYEAAEFVQHLAAGIGAVTLLVAGLIALVQTDIKRVIAYSTMSQIGYMFLAAGIAAYGSAMFHLMTHAFFKALLFLAAGIVIHALAGEQDIRNMGGLRDALPRTYWFMLIGALALAGIFPFAGFWSKDSILASALASGSYGLVLFVAGLLGAFLTGLYTFRMIFLVWRGDRSPYAREHLHDTSHGEAPFSMYAAVAVLAVLSVVGGWLQMAGIWHPLSDWLHPVAEPLVEPSVLQDWITSIVAMAVGIGGIYLAWLLYGKRSVAVPSFPAASRVLEHKLYFDELYDAVFYRPAAAFSRALRRGVEEPLVEGSIDAAATSVREAGRTTTLVQTGYLRSYALAVTAGLAVLAVVFVALR